jgi:hypothetical protein
MHVSHTLLLMDALTAEQQPQPSSRMNRLVSLFSASCSNEVWTTDDQQLRQQPPRVAAATVTVGRDCARARYCASMPLSTHKNDKTTDVAVESLVHSSLPRAIRLGATSRLFLQKQLGITTAEDRSNSKCPSCACCSSDNSEGLQKSRSNSMTSRPSVPPFSSSTLGSGSMSNTASSQRLHPLIQSKRRLGQVAPHLVSTASAELAHAHAQASSRQQQQNNRAVATAGSMNRLMELIREGMLNGPKDDYGDDDDNQKDDAERNDGKEQTKQKKKNTHALSCNELLLYSSKRRRLLNQHQQQQDHNDSNSNDQFSSSSSSSTSSSCDMVTCSSSYKSNNMLPPTSSSSSSSLSLQTTQYYRSIFAQVLNRETSS